MRRYPKNDVKYYVPRRKRAIAGSTHATSAFLALVHEEHPTLTISQLRVLLSDRSQYIYEPEAIAVLDAHIKVGYGDSVPDWRY